MEQPPGPSAKGPGRTCPWSVGSGMTAPTRLRAHLERSLQRLSQPRVAGRFPQLPPATPCRQVLEAVQPVQFVGHGTGTVSGKVGIVQAEQGLGFSRGLSTPRRRVWGNISRFLTYDTWTTVLRLHLSLNGLRFRVTVKPWAGYQYFISLSLVSSPENTHRAGFPEHSEVYVGSARAVPDSQRAQTSPSPWAWQPPGGAPLLGHRHDLYLTAHWGALSRGVHVSCD